MITQILTERELAEVIKAHIGEGGMQTGRAIEAAVLAKAATSNSTFLLLMQQKQELFFLEERKAELIETIALFERQAGN